MGDELNGAPLLIRQGRKLDGFMEVLYDRERRLEDRIRRAVDAEHVLVIHVAGGDSLSVSVKVDRGEYQLDKTWILPASFDNDGVSTSVMYLVGKHFMDEADKDVVDIADPE